MYREQKNNMALASMILGIVSIVSVCCCFFGIIFGGLAVIFAALSRVDKKLTTQAAIGLGTGIAGMILGVVSLIVWYSIMG